MLDVLPGPSKQRRMREPLIDIPIVPDFSNMSDFVKTKKNGESGKVFTLNTEKSIATRGREWTCLTLHDFHGQVAYQTLVKPPNDIVDYHTRYEREFEYHFHTRSSGQIAACVFL